VTLVRHTDVRLVTLTGPGGVGKTRLAYEVISQLGAEFGHDRHVVRLATISDPAVVLPTIADALMVDGNPAVSQVAECLRGRPVLMLLDNFEHVNDAAPIVALLLESCPGLHVLITSRSPLHVRGEHEFAVRPLALPDLHHPATIASLATNPAVALFVQRARAARADFAVTELNAAALASVCVRLDGLPLAIELAAARAKILSPQAMLSRLEHRLTLLAGGAIDLPPRLRSMRDAIAWSYDLLSEAEQTFFRRLAVFTGGFSLDAIPMMTADLDHRECDGIDAVTALVNKSLVVQREDARGEPRFSMLEMIREFGLDQLATAGELDEARGRHAAYYLALAERCATGQAGGEFAIHLPQLALEHDNFRAALAWAEHGGALEVGLRLAGALVGFWYSRSYRAEGHRWLERLLAAAGDVPAAIRAQALMGMGMLSVGTQADERSLAPLRESLALWRQGEETGSIAETLVMLGIKLENLGAYVEADLLMTEAETLLERLGLDDWVALAHHHRGVLAHGQGDVARAVLLIEEAVAHHRRLSQAGVAQGWLASALNDLGWVVAETGDLPRATTLHLESLERWRHAGTLEGVADALANLASVAAAGRLDHQATRLFGAASSLADALGYVFELPERSIHERFMSRLEAAMGEDAFTLAWNAGAGLTLDDAVAEAVMIVPPTEAAPIAAAGPDTMAVTAGLSPRQTEVLRLMASGLTNREIADALSISPRTVQTHLITIFDRFGVRTRAAAVAHAYQHRLV
jgi:predicted ATPase/DNA-binding CsgD family transcriptional regulator